uniref:UTRA domain-containing protein n=1 Tax=Eubacterium cellulosolvens TaxID=29322 RepID=UPI00047F51BE|nr:UTRA domain-containing protein [[Eubacterium] cellulosolvens]
MPAGKFQNIYKDIKLKIENKTYPFGTFLPSETQFTDEYLCSRNTVRRALSILSGEGYIQTMHGKGVQVIYRPLQNSTFTIGGIETFSESARRNHLHADTRVIQFTDLITDDRLSKRTGFPVGTPVFFIQRIRYLNNRPVIFDINIFRASEVPGLTPAIASQSIYNYLENDLGMQIVTCKRRITAEKATQIDCKYIDLKSYDFVSVITGQTYNANGVMFEWNQSRHHPEYFNFYDTVTRKRLTVTE